jgi:hypothetical protein
VRKVRWVGVLYGGRCQLGTRKTLGLRYFMIVRSWGTKGERGESKRDTLAESYLGESPRGLKPKRARDLALN